jgi:hypothetical protein
MSYIFCLLIYVQLCLTIMFDIFVLGKYQVKYMNVYIDPLINELLDLWKGITMYDISRPVGAQREFKFHAMLVCTIHDSLG